MSQSLSSQNARSVSNYLTTDRVLDEIVLTNLKTRVLAPDRIADLLKSLMERRAAKSESVDVRLLALQRELIDAEDRLKRLYRSIEDGIVELDDILRERTAALKSQRERAKAALDRARAQCGATAMIDAAKIDTFARLMNEKLDNAGNLLAAPRCSSA
jgi:site-specific DNA recombinase